MPSPRARPACASPSRPASSRCGKSTSRRGSITPSPALNRLYGFPDDATPTLEDYQSRYAPGEAERLAPGQRRGSGARRDRRRGRGPAHLARRHRKVAADPGADRSTMAAAPSALSSTSTERKRVEQRLVESERRFRLSQNAAGIASLEVDIRDRQRCIGSDHFWELWGLSPRESVHIRVLEDIVLPESTGTSAPTRKRAAMALPSPMSSIASAAPTPARCAGSSRHIEFIHDETGKPDQDVRRHARHHRRKRKPSRASGC